MGEVLDEQFYRDVGECMQLVCQFCQGPSAPDYGSHLPNENGYISPSNGYAGRPPVPPSRLRSTHSSPTSPNDAANVMFYGFFPMHECEHGYNELN